MFDNVVLNVAIGLVFIYLLYSLLATIIQELIATKLAFRSKVLEKAILRMLEDGKSTDDNRSVLKNLFEKTNPLTDKKVATWFYAHPLIKYLGEDNVYSKPSYLSAQNFSKVMIDLLKGFGIQGNITDIQKINESIKNGTIYQLPIDIKSDIKNPATSAIRIQTVATAINKKVDEINFKKDSANKYVFDTTALKLEPGLIKKSLYHKKYAAYNVSQKESIDKANDALGEIITGANTVEINTDTKLFLQSLWNDSGADIDKFKVKLEQWFDDTMDRATGWYKRYTKYILFIIGLLIALCFNVDSILITKKLIKDPKLREQIAKSANDFLEKNKQLAEQLKSTPSQSATLQKLSTDLNTNTMRTNELLDSARNMVNTDIKNVNQVMGLGWPNKFPNLSKETKWTLIPWEWSGKLFWTYLCAIVGWLITALAISLGAPFWFDMLNKLMKLRGTGAKIDGSDSYSSTAKMQPQTPVAVNINNQNSGEAVG
jgi:hypothetical protein